MFIEYEKRDAEKVREFLKHTSYPLSWGEAAETTLLTFDGEKLIGAASLTKNDIHLHREYIGVYVHLGCRRKGVGTALYRRLLSCSQTKQLQAAVSSKNELAVSFLKACGFICARKYYTPDLKKEQMRVPSGPDYSGELYAIYILEEHQRKGIGRQLMAPVVDYLIRNKIFSMAVIVLKANSSQHFYESLGAKRIGTNTLTRASEKLEEFIYGWDDIRKIC